MLFFDGFLGLVMVGVWIFCFIDVLLTPLTQVRNLPKLAWVFIVLLLPTLGSIAWLVAGRPWVRAENGAASLPTSARSDDREPMRAVPARKIARAPDDDEEFLAGLRKRADEQRRRAREAQEPEQGERPGSAD